MTYVLPTINHGVIEAGYYSAFTQEVRMGDFSIPTDKFCEFVAELLIGKNSLRVPTSEGVEVEGAWDPQQRIVKLGEYKISGKNFGVFADYIFNGGFFGWKPAQPKWKPDFVKRAIDCIRQNKGAKKLKLEEMF